jgi:putative oxidoreductase
VAALFVLHPLDSLGVLGGPAPAGPTSAIFVVEICLVALVALGLQARIAAFLLSGMMAFAFFFVHLPDGWNWLENGGEPAALYSWIFLLVAVIGPGPLSLGLRGRAHA